MNHTLHNKTIKAGLGDVPSEPKSTLVSRNITVFGRRTSVRLEPEMWMSLREIAKREGCSIHDICTLISVRKNENTSLTAAIRVFLMLYFRAATTEDGHKRSGHGDFESMKQRARIPTEYNCFFKPRRGGYMKHNYNPGTIQDNRMAPNSQPRYV